MITERKYIVFAMLSESGKLFRYTVPSERATILAVDEDGQFDLLVEGDCLDLGTLLCLLEEVIPIDRAVEFIQQTTRYRPPEMRKKKQMFQALVKEIGHTVVQLELDQYFPKPSTTEEDYCI